MEKRHNLISIIVIGSLWGIIEATLGYILHILSSLSFYGISGMIMSTVAIYFMCMAYKTTNKASSIFYVSLVAASIKLFDLFLPFLPITKTINPAIAILSEGLAFSIGLKFFTEEHRAFSLSMFTGISWRVFYLIGALAFNALLFGHFIPSITWTSYITSFILIQGILNGLVIYPVLKIRAIKALKGEILIRPGFAIILFSLAVALELLSKAI